MKDPAFPRTMSFYSRGERLVLHRTGTSGLVGPTSSLTFLPGDGNKVSTDVEIAVRDLVTQRSSICLHVSLREGDTLLCFVGCRYLSLLVPRTPPSTLKGGGLKLRKVLGIPIFANFLSDVGNDKRRKTR